MRPLALLPLLALVLALTGCGEEAGTGTTAGESPARPAAAPPGGSPPNAPQDGPPPAWVETEAGSFWLGHSSYCWGTVCADFIAPSCHADHVPRIRVRRGETVRFHLGFDPKELSLAVSDRPASLAARRVTSWTVTGGGVLSLFAVREGGGDASYVACLRIPGEPDPPLTVAAALTAEPGEHVRVRGLLLADDEGLRLCDALAESYPPQCGGAALRVEGLDLASVEGLERARGVTWSERQLVLTGTVARGKLVVRS